MSFRTRTVAGLAVAGVLVVTGGLAVADDPPAVGPADAAPGRVLVAYEPGVDAAAQAGLQRAVGAQPVGEVPGLGVRVLGVPAGAEGRVVEALGRRPEVAYAEPDSALRTAAAPDDPYFPAPDGRNGGQWSLRQVQAPAAWDTTTGSGEVVIAVIDTGIVSSQPDLAPQLVPGRNVVTGSSDTSDSTGHGTQAAGVAAAATDNATGVAGMCWTCRLMPVKVTSSSSAYVSDVATGMTWAVDHGAKVLSISLAGTSSSSTLSAAVSYARGHGAVVVAAAGNDGGSTPNYPAALPGVLGVAATDQADALTSYSNGGSWVSIAAPGNNTTTLPTGGYGAVGGTSMATPLVAGAAGLLFAAAPGATGAQVEQALLGTSAPLTGSRTIAGGRLDAAAAVRSLVGAPAPTGSPAPAPAPAPAPPASTSAPAVSGTPAEGSTLTVSDGTWSGSPTSYAYGWQRCASDGNGCTDVAGATGSTYPVTSGDVGSTLRAVVTATGSGGSASATSAVTTVVTTGPAPAPTTTSGPSTTTATYGGSLAKPGARSTALTLGSGPSRLDLSFSKCPALRLVLTDGAGAVVLDTSGASVLSAAATTTGGRYTATVSGSCKTSYSVQVTTPA